MARHANSASYETARRFANCGKSFRKNFIESFRGRFAQLGLYTAAPIEATELRVDALTLRGVGRSMLRRFELGDFRLQLTRRVANYSAKFFCLTAKLFLGNRMKALVFSIDGVDNRLDALSLALVPSADYSRQHSLEHYLSLSI
jgi:hypothetical protein